MLNTSRELWAESLELVLRKQGSPVFENHFVGSDGPTILSAANLWTRALERKRELVRQGLRPGDILAESGDSLDLLINLVACAIGRMIYWPMKKIETSQLLHPNANHEAQMFFWQKDKAVSVGHAMLSQFMVRDSTVLLLGTSGSSGESKLVSISGQALLHQCQSAREGFGCEPDSARLIVLPFSHCFGLIMDLLSGIFSRQTIYLRNDRPFHSDRLMKLIADEKIEYLSLVPRMLDLLLNYQEKNPESCRVLRELKIHVGGAPMVESLRSSANSVFREFIEGYGLTECAGGVLLKGRPNQCEVRLKPGPNVFQSDVQQLWVKSPAIGEFVGRYDTTDEDGFFNTQDFATDREDGSIQILGRGHDLIKNSSGKWVTLIEIEMQFLSRFDLGHCYVVNHGAQLHILVDHEANRKNDILSFAIDHFGSQVRLHPVVSGTELEGLLALSVRKSAREALFDWVREMKLSA